MSYARNLGWLAAGAILLAAGCRRPEVALPGSWFALTFLMRGWRELPPRAGLLSLGVALYAAMAVGTYGSIPVRGPFFFIVVAILSTFTLFPFLLDRWIGRRVEGWVSTLVFPAALVSEEFLRSRIPGGPATWGAFGYTQYGNLPLMQLAAVTGIWGLSFLVAWFASAGNWAWKRGLAASTRALVVSYAALVAGITLLGALRLALPAASPTTVRVATVTSPPGLFAAGEVFRIADGRRAVDATVAEKLARLHDWFFENTEREARAGARLVAWPEMGFLVRSEDEPAALERARGLAAREHIFLAMGIGAVQSGAPRPFQNKTVLIDPSGRVVYSYLKSRPVIGWEQAVMQVGDGRLPVVPTALGRIATAICFDGDHPDLLRQSGVGGTDLAILPVNDWPEVKDSHFAMAAFRAVENGTPLLRPASGGVSGAFDAQGRVLARADHLRGAPTMAAEMPVGAVPTLYARVGDLFAWLCVAACVVAPFLVHRAGFAGSEARDEPVAAGLRFS